MTVRLSYDECGTWPVSKVLYPGPSSYSDLAVAPDMTVCCLYERGVDKYRPHDKNRFPESIRLAQFNLEWLTEGADHL
jgi:sialidase-1